MAATQKVVCACGCGRVKEVRTADVKRGWGKFFSKSCKAKHQERRTGQYAQYKRRSNMSDVDRYHNSLHLFDPETLGQW